MGLWRDCTRCFSASTAVRSTTGVPAGLACACCLRPPAVEVRLPGGGDAPVGGRAGALFGPPFPASERKATAPRIAVSGTAGWVIAMDSTPPAALLPAHERTAVQDRALAEFDLAARRAAQELALSNDEMLPWLDRATQPRGVREGAYPHGGVVTCTRRNHRAARQNRPPFLLSL
jgi:hypothetical protein